jgi:hypothetical protein
MELFAGRRKGKTGSAETEMLYLIDRLHLALGEEFTEGLAGGKQPGYLSRTKRVAILPADAYPPYKSRLKRIEKGGMIPVGRYVGVLGGTIVEHDLFQKAVKALEKDKLEYTILINKDTEMPLIICTKYANIIIAPVMKSYD